MSSNIVRKSQTGEAGNSGEFGTHKRAESAVTLGEPPMPGIGESIRYQGTRVEVVHVDGRTAMVMYENGDLGLLSDRDLGLGRTVPELTETLRKRRGHVFYPKAEMRKWPALGSTDDVKAGDKKVVAHYFGVGDWYVTEADPVDGIAFGYVSLGGRDREAEWGYFSLPELESLTSGPFVAVERDCHFSGVGKKAREVLPEQAWAWQDTD